MHDFTKYFKEKKEFDRIIRIFYEKYKSRGTFSGIIKLEKLTKSEAQVLSRFFGENYVELENIKIPISKFIKIMESSKYNDFEIKTLVEEYLGVNVSTKKEDKSRQKQNEEDYIQKIASGETISEKWLKEVYLKKIPPYKLIHQRYNEDKNSLAKDLKLIIKLINNLPKEKTLLSIYASTYTLDPHYLDIDTKNSNLFFYALSYITNKDYPLTREEKIKMLANANIDIDNLSNFVLTYGLISDKNYINEFTKNKQSLILNIQNILSTHMFDTKKKRVFVFENPSILTEIINNGIDESVIISGGFPNNSVYLLLDALIKTNNLIYYNGDFDPEGLIIASKLMMRYKSLIPICYEKEDYEACISQNIIKNSRMKKIHSINNNELNIIKNLLIEKKCAAYQENNKERILNTIKKM